MWTLGSRGGERVQTAPLTLLCTGLVYGYSDRPVFPKESLCHLKKTCFS